MKIRRMLFLLIMVLVMVIPTTAQGPNLEAPASAKGETQIYLAQMIDDPVVAYEGGIKGLPATKPGNGEKINPNSAHVRKYVDYLDAQHIAALDKVGARNKKVYDYRYSFNGFAARLTPAEATALRAQPDVLRVWEDELGKPDTISTPDFLGLTAEGGLWDMGATGEDVIIGIVDTGIWPESLSFTDRTGTNPNGQGGKLSYHQIPGWHGKCTPGEEFPASDCNQKLIAAQWFNAGYGGDAGVDAAWPWEYLSARDGDGHGSHTASTAGGNSGVPVVVDGMELGAASGMAPRARIAAYKVCWGGDDGGCFSSDSVAAIDQAVADGVDVINFSISGTRTNFLSPVEVAFLFAADAGVFVAASAGTSGPGSYTVAHPSPWIATVAAGTHDRDFTGMVTLGNGESYEGKMFAPGPVSGDLVLSTDVGYDGADATEVRLCYPGTLDPAKAGGKIVVCDRGTIARVDKSYAVKMAGGIGMIHANTSPNSVNADLHYVPTLHVDDVVAVPIRAYAATEGATATLAGGYFLEAEAPFVASFSSRGPLQASSDLLKPDIMAPGQDIIAAVAPPFNGGRSFDSYSGTSMSSPHIAGLAAAIKSVHRNWTPSMIKSALMTTASQETNFGNPIPGTPFDYGAGEVTPNAATEPGLVYNSGWVDWLGFLCGTGQLQASYCPIIGIDPSDLNYPSITIGELAGSQTVRRTVTNVGPAGTYEVSVEAPDGVDVVVEPATLTLAAGESASYAVTFTPNAAAVADAYTFGSLTWSHGPHSVRSPIVVRPLAIAAPAAISGTGTEGSLSFDVTFGYNGDYTAAPHGLSPADMQAATVADDPANDINAALGTCDWSTFPYTCVGLTWHEFEVPAGSVYARFSLFDEYTDGTDDLDLYVWRRSNGAFVGSSGSGTSAEEVNVLFPAGDVYEIAVHGWQTDGPEANYTLFSWAFGPDDGNMTVTAPAAATLGATESVTVDWTGLAAGTKYLGAVSHSDASGLIGLTLVNIDTD